jgi:hypothetical protein
LTAFLSKVCKEIQRQCSIRPMLDHFHFNSALEGTGKYGFPEERPYQESSFLPEYQVFERTSQAGGVDFILGVLPENRAETAEASNGKAGPEG